MGKIACWAFIAALFAGVSFAKTKTDPRTGITDVMVEDLPAAHRFFVELKGEPLGISLHENGRKLSALEVARIRTQLETFHRTAKQEIQSASKNTAQFRYEYLTAWNGFSIDMPADRVGDIEKIAEVERVIPVETAQIPEKDWKYQGKTFLEPPQPMLPPLGISEIWSSGIQGEGVTIAILDTGVDYTHPDLGGCLGPNCKVIGGYDLVNKDADPKDDNNHGTHCAGIAAGDGLKKGAAPKAKIIAYKVLDQYGSGSFDTIIKGFDMALAPVAAGKPEEVVPIMSLSLGGSGRGPDDPLLKATNVAGLYSRVIVAAGNEGMNPMGVPASAENAITVAATDKETSIANFSTVGPGLQFANKPDIAAPGVDIPSTVPGGKYASISGTSMATPLVAGTVALLLSKNKSFTASEVKSWLQQTAKSLSSAEKAAGSLSRSHSFQGAGLIQPKAMVEKTSGLFLPLCKTGTICSHDVGAHLLSETTLHKKQEIVVALKVDDETPHSYSVLLSENTLGAGAKITVTPSTFVLEKTKPQATLTVETDQDSTALPLAGYPFGAGAILQITDEGTQEKFALPVSVFLRAKYSFTLDLPKGPAGYSGMMWEVERPGPIIDLPALALPTGGYRAEKLVMPGTYVDTYNGDLEDKSQFIWVSDRIDLHRGYEKTVTRADFTAPLPIKLKNPEGGVVARRSVSSHVYSNTPRRVRANRSHYSNNLIFPKVIPSVWSIHLSALAVRPTDFILAGAQITDASISEIVMGDKGYSDLRVKAPFGNEPAIRCYYKRDGSFGSLIGGEFGFFNERLRVAKGGLSNADYGISMSIFKGTLTSQKVNCYNYDDSYSQSDFAFDDDGKFAWVDKAGVPFGSIGDVFMAAKGQPIFAGAIGLNGLDTYLFPMIRTFHNGSRKRENTQYRLTSLTSGQEIIAGLAKLEGDKTNSVVRVKIAAGEKYLAEMWFPDAKGGRQMSHAEWRFNSKVSDGKVVYPPNLDSIYWSETQYGLRFALQPFADTKTVKLYVRPRGNAVWDRVPLSTATGVSGILSAEFHPTVALENYEMQVFMEDDMGNTYRMYHQHPF